MKQDTSSPEARKIVIVPKEDAVFWMDDQGCWHNQHGPFEHRALIDHFNASIGKDEDGYFVTQEMGSMTEKVYFRYEVTALFVVDVKWGQTVELRLNTGGHTHLTPENLYVLEDQLYLDRGGDAIKFSQSALMKMSKALSFVDDAYWYEMDGRKYRISVR